MNIEEIRADIFRLFDIRVDKDDPIWAFLYANREIIHELKDIIQLNTKDTKENHKNIKLEMEEFKNTAKESIKQSIDQFDFRLEHFNRDINHLAKHNEDLISYNNRFKSEIRKIYDDKIEHMGSLFDSNIIAIEDRIHSIIEAVDYTRFSKNIEREVDEVVRKSLQEVRAGVSINNRAMDNLREINELNESTIRRLNRQVSTLTTIGVLQTLLFGVSITFIGLIYVSQGTFKFSNLLEQNKETPYVVTEKTLNNG